MAKPGSYTLVIYCKVKDQLMGMKLPVQIKPPAAGPVAAPKK